MEQEKRTQTIVFIAIMTALVAAVTAIIQVPIPTGYLNFGDVIVMMSAIVLPIRGAVIAAGVGSAIVDLMVAPQYAIFTLFIKMAEVVVIQQLIHLLDGKKRFIPFFLAGFTMMTLYGFVDAFLVGNITYMPVSMMYNLIQAFVSSLIATLIYPGVVELMKHLRGKG
ncbi:ECF transporter S component [Erysipelothrix urinaevulpis]|uniref:ECF transporter S component n=1 Tax=Erysipelothrix urinaevulpis TaxID=2683717 RepID=UPI001359908F|nr:ECF transporter S component [Erysipelothrix urinaevulpis]